MSKGKWNKAKTAPKKGKKTDVKAEVKPQAPAEQILELPTAPKPENLPQNEPKPEENTYFCGICKHKLTSQTPTCPACQAALNWDSLTQRA